MQDEKTEYKKYLDARKGADQYNEFKKILYGQPDSLVPKIFAFIFPYIKKRKRIKILDIGGGDGKRLRQLVDLLESKNIETNATLVEPSKAFTDDCLKTIKGSRYDIEVVDSLFEDFKSKEKFDLILMIHSFYAFRDFPIIKKVSSLMAKDGYSFIAGNDDDSFLAKLKKISESRRKGKRKEISFIFSDLEHNKFKYGVKKIGTTFDNCVRNNKLTDNGRLLVSWMMLEDYSKISSDIRKEIFSVFRKECRNSKITEKEVFILARK